MVYIAGHLKNKSVLETIYSEERKTKRREKEGFLLCYERSTEIAKIVSDKEGKNTLEYLCQLMDNPKKRLLNRSYQLYYYEDRREVLGKEPIPLENSIDKGFDFHNTYLVLSEKLRYYYDKKTRYSLMEFDLFTICDLVYSRLQCTKTGELASFFYKKDYNESTSSKALDVMDSVIQLIDSYIFLIRNKRKINSRVVAYFNMMLSTFKTVRKKIEENQDRDCTKTYVSHTSYLEKVYKLESARRIGWDINSVESEYLSEADRKQLIENEEKCKETIAEHILEALYIAELYLPMEYNEENSKYNGKYDKGKIMSLILLREIGKYKTGDYNPAAQKVDKLKKEESKARSEFFLLGALDGYANLIEFNKLFESEDENTGNDINLIISREIEVIQLEYKYYKLKVLGKISFGEERSAEFEREFEKVRSNLGIEIRDKLILKNPDFEEYM